MRRVTAGIDPAMDATSTRYGEQFGASLSVTTQAGQAFSAAAASPIGHSPRNPLSQATLDSKFHNCATRVLSETASEALATALRSLATAPSLRAIAALARSA